MKIMGDADVGGDGGFTRYEESAAERKDRLRRELKARRSFRLTDGQRKTLRRARRLS